MKNWIATAVAIIAVVVSVSALCLDYKHAEDALQSQQDSDARHDEQFATAMSKAGEANGLAREANELAGEANGFAGEANDATEKYYQELKLSDMLSMLHIRLNDQREWLNPSCFSTNSVCGPEIRDTDYHCYFYFRSVLMISVMVMPRRSSTTTTSSTI